MIGVVTAARRRATGATTTTTTAAGAVDPATFTVLRVVAYGPRWSRGTQTATEDTTWQAPITVAAPTNRLQVSYQMTGTLAAAVEIGGTVYPFTFGGAARVTQPASTRVTSDLLTVPQIAAGTVVRVRTFLTNGSIAQRGMSGQNGPRQYASGDLTVSGSAAIPVLTGYGESRITPILMAGYTEPGRKSVAGLGDSIMEGGSDSQYEPGPGGGFFTRALASAGVAGSCYGVWADNAPTNPDADPRFGTDLTKHTHAICEYGTNALGDIAVNQGGNWKVLAQRIYDFCAWASGQGVKVAQTTLIPKTSGTYTTTDGQAVPADGTEAVRLGFNAWLRDGAPMLSGAPVDPGTAGAVRTGGAGHAMSAVIDTEAAVRFVKADGSIVFDVDPGGVALVVDGTHPSAAGHARMAAPLADWIRTLTA